MNDEDPAKSGRVMNAIQMTKLDIKKIKQAYNGNN
jgi:hypothetical protein